MSRSKRKTPIFGNASAKSERHDKQMWHSRMRARVRTHLVSAAAKPFDAYLSPDKNEVSSVWSMAKDGKRYFHPHKQNEVAERFSQRGKTTIERQSLKIRLLKKFARK